MTSAWVRPARTTDADAVTDVQRRAWRHAYREIVPAPVLAQMTSEAATAEWRRRWGEAVSAPPSERHRLLVAIDGGDASDAGEPAATPEAARAAGAQTVAGFAAHGPVSDPDLDPNRVAELLTLLVDPDRLRRGHGSRLLAATVDHLREDGFTTAVTWVFEDDRVLRDFLAAAGWAPDGTRRALDMGRPVPMIRMHTALE